MALTLMSWNIENLGADKAIVPFARFVAAVMKRYGVILAAFQELRNAQAGVFGNLVTTELSSMVDWCYLPTAPYGDRREQYLWVYRDDIKCAAQQDTWYVKDRKGNTVVLGFPRQRTSDRPPHMVWFDFPRKDAKGVRLATFHAPGPGDQGPTYACQNLAKVSDLTDKSKLAGVLGDFNISPSPPQQDPGKSAFGPMQGVQLIWQVKNGTEGVYTSLRALSSCPPPKPETMDEAWSAQYDNVFGRPEAQFSDGSVVNLLEDCLSGDPADQDIDRSLRKYIYVRKKLSPPGGMVAPYANLREVFVDYRTHVSDHMPILVDVGWD